MDKQLKMGMTAKQARAQGVDLAESIPDTAVLMPGMAVAGSFSSKMEDGKVMWSLLFDANWVWFK